MADTETPGVAQAPQQGMNPKARAAIATLVVAAAVVGLVLTVQAATTGEESTSLALPDSVELLIPASGAEVLAQSPVGVDLAIGYDAYLIINGTEIRDAGDGLERDMGLGRITYQPGQDKEIEALVADRNCVIAMVWPQTESEETAEPVSWCFTAA